MMEERASSIERRATHRKDEKKKSKNYLVFASAALLDDAHFGRFSCHDDDDELFESFCCKGESGVRYVK